MRLTHTALFAFLNLTCVARCFNLALLSSCRHEPLQAVVISTSVPNRLTKADASSVINTVLHPIEEYGERLKAAKDAQGFDPTKIIVGDDPRLCFSYGEFPMHSTDELLDLALAHMPEVNGNIEMLDLGSGCGRLACYFSLTRGTTNQPWSLRGLEISHVLTDIALNAVRVGISRNIFSNSTDTAHRGRNTLSLHRGPAEDLTDVLRKSHLIFTYCSTFKTSGFSPELQAMILDEHWSKLLSNACRKGCVVITTDRALDPLHGWELLDHLEVDNREVMGSTGYVQRLI